MRSRPTVRSRLGCSGFLCCGTADLAVGFAIICALRSPGGIASHSMTLTAVYYVAEVAERVCRRVGQHRDAGAPK